VVVGGQRVDLLAPVLHRVPDQDLGIVRRGDTVDEDVAVADAALIGHVVEIKRAVFVEYRPDHLARGRGDAAVHDRNLVLERRLLGVLRVELHVGLGIEAHHLHFAAEQAAGGVDLFDGKYQQVVHRLAGTLEAARQVVHAGDYDRVGSGGSPDDARG